MSEITYGGVQLSAHTIEVMDMPSHYALPVVRRRRRSFYRQHELAIWLIAVGLLALGYYLALSNNAEIIWRLSTPLIRLVP